MAIAIVDDGANLLYLQRLDRTQLAGPEIAVAKAASAVKYKRSTKTQADALVGGRQAVLALSGAMPVEGGLLVSNETIVDAIGVSGVFSRSRMTRRGRSLRQLARRLTYLLVGEGR